ncbi:MAG TPA: phosphoribosylglycinamide formyltransferase [Actinomycetota bacterium]|nr:phosphoribosylglycinamide formyltransferase [Actinomycetota bacterium]
MDGRVAVLASGAGSNLGALLSDPEVGPRIVLVLTDRPGAGALERAREAGVATETVDREAFPDRAAFDRGLLERLRAHAVDALVLAGYMRILGPEVVRAFPDRILNVHPSLLPAFPGPHAVREALAWGVRVTGCTVHLVDEEVDHGPIVFQEAVPVVPGDDEASLHARIKQAEHRLLPAAARLLVEGRLAVEDRMVRVLPVPDGAPLGERVGP